MRHLRLVIAAAVALAAGAAQAKSGYLSAFNTRYGTSGTVLNDCNLCHSADPYNPYGIALQNAGIATNTTSAFAAVEPLDSDKDGYTNLQEINARTLPGDAASLPKTVTYCADADGDGYVVCSGSCTVPAGKACGDCNDASAAASPDGTEGPYGSATCGDRLDNDCDGALDGNDSQCVPANSDYDIQSLAAPATAVLRRATSVSVTVVNAGTATGGATLTLAGRLGRKTTTLASGVALTAAPGASQTLTFPWKPSTVGTVVWTATITDATNDADEATASTTVTK
jgi:hypothetical protein